MTVFLVPCTRRGNDKFRGQSKVLFSAHNYIEPMKSRVVFQVFSNISGLLYILNFEDISTDG